MNDPAIDGWFDAHLHLQDPRFGRRAPALWRVARNAGVGHAICCATHPGDWAATAAIAHACPGVIPAFGVHPHHAEDLPTDWLDGLEARLWAHPDAPVGEIGLDGAMRGFNPEAQRAVFKAQLDLAAGMNRPVVVHAVRCWGALIEQLGKRADRGTGLMVHAFSGSAETLRALCRLGVRISFGGAVTDARFKRARECARRVPRENLVVETDCPDGFPADAERDLPGPRSCLNTPANLTVVIRALAGLRDESVAELGAQCARNVRVFLSERVDEN